MKQQELEKIIFEEFTIICSLKNIDGKWNFFDCNGDSIRTPDINSIFTSSMFDRYRDKTKTDFFKDESRVWAMIGLNSNNIVAWLQVGRNNNRSYMLSNDIKEDIKDFLLSDESNGKYGGYREKFSQIVFIEINIHKYLSDDDLFYKTFGVVPDDNIFAPAYYCLLASYVEGKLAYEKKVEMYNTSTLDGYFYRIMKDSDCEG